MAKGLLVRFFMDTKKLGAESEAKGYPVFKDVEMVSIIPLGDNRTELHREVSETDRQRFKDEYTAFKLGEEQSHFVGMPLKEWPQIVGSMVKTLNYFNIFTVEQLAEIDDGAIGRIGIGTRDLVTKARAYLAQAKDTAASQRYAVENARLEARIIELQDQITKLATQMSKQTA